MCFRSNVSWILHLGKDRKFTEKQSQIITRNQRKTESPSSPPQYLLSTLKIVPSTASPTICRASNLGLPDHQEALSIRIKFSYSKLNNHECTKTNSPLEAARNKQLTGEKNENHHSIIKLQKEK